MRSVRIGGGSAGYGDGTMATPRLITGGALDYVMLDYLSEYFMPQAGRARRHDPQAGYVSYFPDELFSAILPDLLERKVKLISNVGAVNPHACGAAMQAAMSCWTVPTSFAPPASLLCRCPMASAIPASTPTSAPFRSPGRWRLAPM